MVKKEFYPLDFEYDNVGHVVIYGKTTGNERIVVKDDSIKPFFYVFENGKKAEEIENIRVNEEIQSGAKAEVKTGNTLPLKNIPSGTMVYNLEIMPGDGGKLCRAPGMSAKLLSHLGKTSLVELPSKKKKEIVSE